MNGSSSKDAMLSMSLDDLIATSKSSNKSFERPRRTPNRRSDETENGERFSNAFGMAPRRRRSYSPRNSSSSKSTMVKVTNIPFDLNWKDVKNAFSDVGGIDRCDVDNGIAWVRFHKHADAVAAVRSYDGGDMNGRTIQVHLA